MVALMLYLDDAMKVLLQHDFIDDGYIDDDGGSEIVRSELEQKCYLREPVDIVRCKDCIAAHDGELIYEMWCGITGKRIMRDDFCSNGRRKDE